MPDVYYFVAAVLLLFESGVFVFILSKLLPRRFPIKGAFIVLAIFSVQMAKTMIDDQIIRWLISNVADIAIVFLFFKEKKRYAFIYPLIFYNLLFICEGFTVSLFWLV